MKQRNKDTDKVRGTHKAADMSYNEQSGGSKVVGPILGLLTRLSTFSVSPAPLPAPFVNGGVIAFYNPTAATAWLSISKTAIAPPAPGAAEPSSIALKPNDYTILAMPDGATQVACDVATVVIYFVEDDSYIG